MTLSNSRDRKIEKLQQKLIGKAKDSRKKGLKKKLRSPGGPPDTGGVKVADSGGGKRNKIKAREIL